MSVKSFVARFLLRFGAHDDTVLYKHLRGSAVVQYITDNWVVTKHCLIQVVG